MHFGAVYICSHCACKHFFEGDNYVNDAEELGWRNVDAGCERLELCNDCYDDYLGAIRAFRLGTEYHMPCRDRQNQFVIHAAEKGAGC